MAEEVLDSLGADPSARQEAAHKLVYDGLMEPAQHISMPDSLEGHIKFEHQQMFDLEVERPTVRQCQRVTTLWYRWVEA